MRKLNKKVSRMKERPLLIKMDQINMGNVGINYQMGYVVSLKDRGGITCPVALEGECSTKYGQIIQRSRGIECSGSL